jgi:hypothetical protein
MEQMVELVLSKMDSFQAEIRTNQEEMKADRNYSRNESQPRTCLNSDSAVPRKCMKDSDSFYVHEGLTSEFIISFPTLYVLENTDRLGNALQHGLS